MSSSVTANVHKHGTSDWNHGSNATLTNRKSLLFDSLYIRQKLETIKSCFFYRANVANVELPRVAQSEALSWAIVRESQYPPESNEQDKIRGERGKISNLLKLWREARMLLTMVKQNKGQRKAEVLRSRNLTRPQPQYELLIPLTFRYCFELITMIPPVKFGKPYLSQGARQQQ
jgi:hypothetical protein